MRFLYFGDLHERPEPPVNRKDDFRLTVSEKIKEIRMLGKKYRVKAFLQPGDFLETPRLNFQFLSEVINRWDFGRVFEDILALAKGDISEDEITRRTEDHIPIIGAIGNHELYGGSLRSYPKTSLHFLEKIGFIHIPDKDNPILFTDEEGFTVAITAGSYDTGMDTPETIDRYIVEEKMGDFHIHIVHGYLTNRSLGQLIPHTTIDDIAYKTQADLTISGHDHVGFPLTEVNGKLFVNPGAVVRLTNDLKEVQRIPKVLLIEITKEKGIEVKEIPLKSARDGNLVLDRSHQAYQKAMSDKVEKIKSLVQKSKVGSGLSITEIIRVISDAEKIDERLKERAIELVSEKMKNIQTPNGPARDYTIDKIVLENFQSHAYSEYELKPGLNVFMGKSSSGKSAIQRALAWVFENEGKNPRRFIKNGEDFARVSLFLSNGFVISRIIEKKKGGKNGYEIFNPNDGTVTFYNTKSLPLVQEILGFNYLQIDDKKSVPLNFQKQGMSWFYIGDGFTDTDRAKIIGAVYQTHFVDAVIKDLESENKKLAIRMKEKKQDIRKIDETLEQYSHLPDWERKIEEIDKRLKRVKELEERKERIRTLYETLQEIERQIEKNRKIVGELEIITKLEGRLWEVEKKTERKNRIVEKMEELGDLNRKIRDEKSIIQSLRNIEGIASRAVVLERRVREYLDLKTQTEKASFLQSELNRISGEINKAKGQVASLKDIESIERRWDEVFRLVEKNKKAKEIYNELVNIVKKGKAERAYIQKLDKEYRRDVHEYQKLLQEIGTCPLCQSHVTNETIESIAKSYLS